MPALRAVGLNCIARIQESEGVTDLALQSENSHMIVVRCVSRVLPRDYSALKSMVADGDFGRAALIYTDAPACVHSGDIESWPLDQVEELAASLARWVTAQ